MTSSVRVDRAGRRRVGDTRRSGLLLLHLSVTSAASELSMEKAWLADDRTVASIVALPNTSGVVALIATLKN